MDLGLKDRVVLVTGGGQGIGREIGIAFAREGAHVAFHYRSSVEGAEAAAEDSRGLGVRAVALGADVTRSDEVGELVARAEEALGPIEVLVNNAAFTRQQRFLESTPADWAPQIDVTITGLLMVSQAVLRGMVERKSGSIVTLTGDSGRVGESRLVVTATARAAAIGFTRSLAKEFARDGVRVNCVSLGLVETPSFAQHSGVLTPELRQRIIPAYPLRRLGRMEDVPPAVLLLASPLAGWITGQVLAVNGGYSMV